MRRRRQESNLSFLARPCRWRLCRNAVRTGPLPSFRWITSGRLVAIDLLNRLGQPCGVTQDLIGGLDFQNSFPVTPAGQASTYVVVHRARLAERALPRPHRILFQCPEAASSEGRCGNAVDRALDLTSTSTCTGPRIFGNWFCGRIGLQTVTVYQSLPGDDGSCASVRHRSGRALRLSGIGARDDVDKLEQQRRCRWERQAIRILAERSSNRCDAGVGLRIIAFSHCTPGRLPLCE